MTKVHRSRRSSTVQKVVIAIAAVATLYLASGILIPLAFAVILTLILAPAVGWLVKKHVGRSLASVAVVLIAVIGAGLIGYIIFNQLIQVLNELPGYQNNIHRKIEAMRLPAAGALGRATESVKELGKELSNATTPDTPPAPVDPGIRRAVQTEPGRPLPVHIIADPTSEFQYLRDLTQPFLAPLRSTGIVLIFTVFLLIEQDDLRNRLFRLAGVGRLNLMTQALDDATQRVSRYLMLQFLVNSCFGILSGIGLYAIGVPYAALWGTVAAILRIVPYVGSPLAAILPLALSLAVFDGWRAPLLVLLLFVILELLAADLVEPWLFGRHTGISSLALLVTAVFWATFWGPAGLILSTPLTVCLVVLGRYIPQFSFLHVLLGDEPVLPPEAQVYQRLLALDDQGARLLVAQHLSTSSMLELHDSVIIPALAMLERDRRKGTLDPDREEFVLLNIREMLGEFSDQSKEQEHTEDGRHRPTGPGRILCLPARHESDEIIAAMLAQLLEEAGCVALSFTNDGKLEQLRRVVVPTENDVFLISALPPFAFAPARTLIGHLQRRFSQTRVVVGIWGFTGDTTRALQSFQPLRPDKVVTSLASAIESVVDREGGVSVEPEVQTSVS